MAIVPPALGWCVVSVGRFLSLSYRQSMSAQSRLTGVNCQPDVARTQGSKYPSDYLEILAWQ